MQFDNIEELNNNGFIGFIKMKDLFVDSSILPEKNGVYLVIKPQEISNEFLEIGTGGFFKGKNPNVSITELKDNWVDKSKVVYIGKATSLKKRLKQYIGFGQGKNIGHYGGRLIWQLKYSKELIVCWKILGSDPGVYESQLIQQFKLIYGKRPFANLKD